METVVNIPEHIKTFADAAKAIGIDDPEEWEKHQANVDPDILAYLKLRIIVKALNDGWEPQFTEDERRYYPNLFLCPKKGIDGKRISNVQPIDDYITDFDGFGIAYSILSPTVMDARFPAYLCLKSFALAQYCAEQFIDIWMDLCLIRSDY